MEFSAIHDIRQIAFLLDPLRRDRSLSGLIGGELGSEIDQVAASWQVYGWQLESLASKPDIAKIARVLTFR